MELNKELIDSLTKLAEHETCDDIVEAGRADYVDFCCGNEDDARSQGREDGQTDIARQVLDALGIAYIIDRGD